MNAIAKVQTSTTETGIHARALLVWLQISTWAARKYDRRVTAEVHAVKHANSDSGRYNKNLAVGDPKTYKALVSLCGTIRAEHYAHTLAWSDEGWRMLPVDNYMIYTAWYRQRSHDVDVALNAFLPDYPSMQAQAIALSNGIVTHEDFPSQRDMAKRFGIHVEYSPVPSTGDVRVDLARDQISAIESSIVERVDAATRIAMQDAWSRLHGVVAKIADRLSDPEAIFRDTLIDNAREVCSALRRLNVIDDRDLERMRATVERELTKYDPEVLRDERQIRETTARKAEQIMSQMSAFYSDSDSE